MELFVIYIILSAFGIGGTEAWEEFPVWVKVILCVMLGWLLFPPMIMFVFGKFINDVNHRY